MSESEIDTQKKLPCNGINASTGTYAFEPLSFDDLATVAQGKPLRDAGGKDEVDPEQAAAEKAHLAELRARNESQDEAHFGVKEGIDPLELEQAGWGVIFPAVKPNTETAAWYARVREALSPLLDLRRRQATAKHDRYREYFDGKTTKDELGYKPGESKQKFLARLGIGPGPADPDKVPYYLLLVGSPEEIPFRVQYQIDVQYAVGRLYFETIEEYDNYARSVVAAETGLVLPRTLALVGVHNPDDDSTRFSREYLIGPLAENAATWDDLPGWTVEHYFDGDATKSKVSELFGGPKTPALLFTASHGIDFNVGDPLQRRHQGGLLLQDWTGPKQWQGPIGPDLYLSGDDLTSTTNLSGMINFNFACYGAGTPLYDEFARQAFRERTAIAEAPFVSGLHARMAGLAGGGALASIGHVDRAWTHSFMWKTGGRKGSHEPQLAVFDSTIRSLMKGVPVGHALDYFNVRYAELSSDLTDTLDELEWEPDHISNFDLAKMWTSNNDARGYAIFGDPAVRLPLDPSPDAPAKARHEIVLSSVAASAPASAAVSPPPEQPDEPDEPDTADTPAPEGPDPDGASFGLGDRWRKKSEDDAPDSDAAPVENKPSAIASFAERILDTLGRAIDDAITLEVRTYVSDNPNAAAAADRQTLANQGSLRAFTRIAIDGDMDVNVPQTDGKLDQELWQLHLEMVKQAQATRAATMQTVLEALSQLIK